MLFNTFEFFVFLLFVYSLYWLLRRREQNLLLLVASYVFYGWWDWRFLLLIIISSTVQFISGLRIERSGQTRRKRLWLTFSVVTNLGVLGIFKYLDFGVESFAQLLQVSGIPVNVRTLGIALPVGISFYTFQGLSYTIDIYRNRIKSEPDIVALFAFIAFFPQLIAGPIERAFNLLPQFRKDRRFDPSVAVDGCRQMLWGLFLKIVVADNLASYVDRVYADPYAAEGWPLLWATYFFALQIYCDFAGYSHIAIGCSRLFGIRLMRNFAYPYFSRSPAEFWHRWHISLSTWFRDYVYIPMGGNRVGWLRNKANILVTFAVSGLWHGAGVTFLFWGLLHGLLVAAQWWSPKTKLDEPCGKGTLPSVRDLMAMILVFHITCVAWVFFRADDLSAALHILGTILPGLAAHPFAVSPVPLKRLFLAVGLLLLVEWIQRDRAHALDVGEMSMPARRVIYARIAQMTL